MNINYNTVDKSANSILEYCAYPDEGLPEKIFLMVSALVPIPNVDLFIFNKKKEILLLWRDDIFFGKGWSIPGGCIRFNETLEQRVHRTALKELGQDVKIIEGPIAVRDVIRGPNKNLKYPNYRGHNITIPYICGLSDENIDSDNKNIRWFNKIPENILKVHHVYFDLFEQYGLMNK